MNSSDSANVLIITDHKKLKYKYGLDEYSKLINFIGTESEKSNRKFDFLDVSIFSSWVQIKEYLRSKVSLYFPEYIVILGNGDIVPFCTLNLGPEKISVLSDSFYTDFDEGMDHFPKIPIGRLPDATSGATPSIYEIASLLFETENAIINNKYALSSEAWLKPSKMVYKQLDNELGGLVSCPPHGLRLDKLVHNKIVPQAFYPSTIYYFNLHGLDSEGSWFGERRNTFLGKRIKSVYAEALSPNFINMVNLSHSIVISSACFTSNINGRSEKNSLALALLKSGCSAVVGPSSFAFSSLLRAGMVNLTGIDLLCQNLLQYLLTGKSIGKALMLTKQHYPSQGYYDDINILGLTLLGNPGARISEG